MENPLDKQDHKLLIAGILLGAAAAGVAVYFFRDELAELLDGLLSKVQPGAEPEGEAAQQED